MTIDTVGDAFDWLYRELARLEEGLEGAADLDPDTIRTIERASKTIVRCQSRRSEHGTTRLAKPFDAPATFESSEQQRRAICTVMKRVRDAVRRGMREVDLLYGGSQSFQPRRNARVSTDADASPFLQAIERTLMEIEDLDIPKDLKALERATSLIEKAKARRVDAVARSKSRAGGGLRSDRWQVELDAVIDVVRQAAERSGVVLVASQMKPARARRIKISARPGPEADHAAMSRGELCLEVAPGGGRSAMTFTVAFASPSRRAPKRLRGPDQLLRFLAEQVGEVAAGEAG